MAKNTMLLMLISAIGVVLSFAKESIVAYFFGTSATVDAYVVAVDLPVSLFSLISMALLEHPVVDIGPVEGDSQLYNAAHN